MAGWNGYAPEFVFKPIALPAITERLGRLMVVVTGIVLAALRYWPPGRRMNGGLILPLVAGLAFVIAVGVILDATNAWSAERSRTGRSETCRPRMAIFLCLLVLAITAWVCVMTTRPG